MKGYIEEEFNKKALAEYRIRLKVLIGDKDSRKGSGRPQKFINQLIDDCHIYIGLMGKRFGGSTGLFKSGTHEEYVYAYQRWEREKLPHMRFFFKKFSLPSDAPEEDLEQLRLIREFQKQIKGHFYFDFLKRSSDLIEKLEKQLGFILKDLQIDTEAPPTPQRILEKKEILSFYRSFLHKHYSKLQIFQKKYINLDKIYVPFLLELNPELWHCMDRAEFLRQIAKKRIPGRIQEIIDPQILKLSKQEELQGSALGKKETLTASEVLECSDRIIILGEAGSGKTTLFKHLVWRHKDPKSHFVPVHLTCQEWFQSGFGDPLKGFPRSLNKRYGEFSSEMTPVLREKLESLWDERKILLMLDGLDEISRDDFTRACEFLNAYDLDGNKVLVSCRRHSYDPILQGDLWWVFSIIPFSREDREKFIENYFGRGNPKIQRLSGLVEGRPLLRSMGKNPLLLGLICYIYEKYEENLPEARVVLYENCVNELLARRKQQEFGSLSDFKKDFLGEVAFDFFQNKDVKQRQWFPKKNLSDRLRRMILKREESVLPLTVGKVQEFLKELSEKNSLLLPVGMDSYCFPHRSFQEYFAAAYLDQKQDVMEMITEDLCSDDFWSETICLYAAMQSDPTDLVNRIGEKKMLDLILRMIPDLVRLDWDRLDKKTLNWKIRRGAVEKMVLPEPDKNRLEEITDILEGVLMEQQHDPNANVRYSAWVGLEKIGTSRALEIVRDTFIIPPEILSKKKKFAFKARNREIIINDKGMPPNMAFVPGGSFMMGETGRHVKVRDFFLDLFPATNGQFRKFIEAGGYDNHQFWSKKGWQERKRERWKEPRTWDDPRFNHDGQPVVAISWYEAEAYCAWLTASTHSKLPYRLPTEEEWEYAARGSERDEWTFGAWSEDIPRWDSCFGYEDGLTFGPARVNSVYNQSVSGFGIFDMIGQVWEWTGSWYDNKQKKSRVLRGGSWLGVDPDGLRGSVRGMCNPRDRGYDVGFRYLQDSP